MILLINMENRGLYLRLGLLLVAVAITYFLAVVVVPRALVTMTKAAPASIVSIVDSKIIGEKILAKADGKDSCVVNVFIMDKSGKGVSGKEVVIEGLPKSNFMQQSTNIEGKASFKLTSLDEGTFKIMATVSGAELANQIRVTFRN